MWIEENLIVEMMSRGTKRVRNRGMEGEETTRRNVSKRSDIGSK